MNIIYCNVGEMNEYNGIANDSIQGGGSFNIDNIGHEVNNFTNHDGVYYGFVQASSNTIDITTNFGAVKDAEYIDNILVIWMIKNKTVVGYYKDARVFRKLHSTPEDIAIHREYDDYNFITTHAVLIPKEQRRFSILNHTSRSNVWYGDEQNNQRVIEFVKQYENSLNSQISLIEDFSEPLIGIEKEVLVKQRVNQGKFRELLLNLR